MIQRLTNRQIINVVEQYFVYKTRLSEHRNALKWELMNRGETEEADKLRGLIKSDNETIGQFLDMEV